MKLDHIDLSKLKLSPLNVRKHGGDDVADLVASIRARGVLQPLLVRPDDEDFEVIAGQRRLTACHLLAQEGEIEPIPCAIMEEGDDAAAIEASLAENIQRLPMDELDQYAAFAELIRKRRTVDDIASHFGVTERLVKQRLALANLDKRILDLYRKDELSGETMRALTLATKTQQKAWLKRFRDPQDHAPYGRALKQWILGGEQIETSAALFAVSDYKEAIVTDLFGEESYFADPQSFWSLQKQAIAAAAASYEEKGWAEVVVMENVSHFPDWEYRKVAKKKGGRVYVTIAGNGEVAFYEGYLPEKELRKLETKAKAESSVEVQQARPELTKAAQNYVDLHRHAAVQAALISNASMTLRLVTAHMIAGSSLWTIRPEPQRAEKLATKLSVETGQSAHAVRDEHDAVLDLLGIEREDGFEHLVDTKWSGRAIHAVFEVLLGFDDEQVMRVMTYAMAETLEAGTELIDRLGTELSIDMAKKWQADDAFLDLIGNKATLGKMLAEIGGENTSDAHKASTAKVMRSVIRQYVTGEGRGKVEGWLPSTMAFAASEPQRPEESERAAA